ncbi:MAG: MoxR family ATPase [Anaerolineaceae bacterium]|nr:MoxR family ATPase [Anaerolineaceae bacterium]
MNSNDNMRQILREVGQVIVGKDEIILKVLLAMLANGHILMEDIPGVGKTTLAVSVSRSLGLDYNRVQFTPDVLPSDITGYSLYDKNTGSMQYQKGAILCNLFLADELNRATSRTQSALLQAMEEGEVTVDNFTYPVPKPFLVIATQNPAGAKGTQLLPDSQLDRFLIRLTMGYPSHEDEIEMVRRRQMGVSAESLHQVADRTDLLEAQQEVDQVYIKDDLISYIVSLCEKTRSHPAILQGASPRGSLALTALAKASAWLQRRDYVIPRDVRFIFSDCIAHRLIWSQETADSASRAEVLSEIFQSVRPPAV